MNMKKLPFGTLFSNPPTFRRCVFLVGAFCNATIDPEVSQWPVEKINASMLADNIKSRGSGSDVEKKLRKRINCVLFFKSLRLKHRDVISPDEDGAVIWTKPSVRITGVAFSSSQISHKGELNLARPGPDFSRNLRPWTISPVSTWPRPRLRLGPLFCWDEWRHPLRGKCFPSCRKLQVHHD
jgi:hypothetical protein